MLRAHTLRNCRPAQGIVVVPCPERTRVCVCMGVCAAKGAQGQRPGSISGAYNNRQYHLQAHIIVPKPVEGAMWAGDVDVEGQDAGVRKKIPQ